jgi:hypothetical protein
MISYIDLRCESVVYMAARLLASGRKFRRFHADPPWPYHDTGNKGERGQAAAHYDTLAEIDIAKHLALTAPLAADNAYMFVWITMPKLWEWIAHDHILRAAGWHGISGAGWGKRQKGIGHHFRGKLELVLLYKHGHPHPVGGALDNFWQTPDPLAELLEEAMPYWYADRKIHSEKPQIALRDMLAMSGEPGDPIVDFYAGARASMARAALAWRATWPGDLISGEPVYYGAEIDAKRHAQAMALLSQHEIAFVEPAQATLYPIQEILI